MRRRVVIGGTGLALGSFLLAACGDSGSTSSGTGSAETAGTPTATGMPPVTITDQRGKKLILRHAAHRIVTIPMPAASILVAVDQGVEHLVGMHNASWQAMRDGILGEIFPKALDIPHNIADNNFAPNVESVLALKPDLVIQWGDDGAAITAPLENVGLKVAGLKYGTQDDVATWITLFATALGRPERAHELNSPISAALKTMTTIGKSAPKPAPKILYFNRFEGGLKVAGNGSYNDFYIKLIGGQNPASGPHGAPGKGMVGVDIEQVLAWDPDIILLGNFDAAMPDDVYQKMVWRGISAVKKRHVYKVPLGGYRWDPPSHESPLMWRWLSMVAFPQQKPFDLRADVKTSYKRFYNHEPTVTQLDKILWMKANQGSSGYRQFHA